MSENIFARKLSDCSLSMGEGYLNLYEEKHGVIAKVAAKTVAIDFV